MATNITSFVRAVKDCWDWYSAGFRQNGVYKIHLNDSREMEVYCNMQIDGGGWIVFQRRFNGGVNFNRSWEEYKWGFGEKDGEYWLGNEYVHQITTSAPHQLYVHAVATDGKSNGCKYAEFHLNGEQDSYRMFYSFEHSGICFGYNGYHNRTKFGTFDRDTDNFNEGNCAARFQSGWWYSNCFKLNLNGFYNWFNWKDNVSLEATLMMIRRI